jgi:hypothetical protein
MDSQQSQNIDQQPGPQRSRVLEVMGILAAVGFFIGIFFAWRTQVGSLVTQRQFDQIAVGQTLAEVEASLGKPGTVETAEPTDGSESSDAVTYVWENSTDSKVVCVFVNGQLSEKSATNLP